MNHLESNNNPKIIELSKIDDKRGYFIKSFNKSEADKPIPFEIYEQFYTHSIKNVLRGFHFQHPPYEQAKIIHCIQGEILDVIIDIRKNTKNYGKIYSYYLSSKNPSALYIPATFAHAFLCVSDNCLVNYNLNNEYSSKLESGISWESVDFSWPIKKPIVSDRDKSFVDFKNFESPF